MRNKIGKKEAMTRCISLFLVVLSALTAAVSNYHVSAYAEEISEDKSVLNNKGGATRFL